MVTRHVRTVAAPPVLHYLAIDGTGAQDAATFGALLERHGWKNLASVYLSPARDDPKRLVDPAHEYLPIPLIAAKGKKVAVVSPNGTDGKGLDAFWMQYPGEAKTKRGNRMEGRYAAAELSTLFMSQLILTPAIHTHELKGDVLVRHFADRGLPYASRHPPAARIIYVSSHGWLSGSMAGNQLAEAPAARPPVCRMPYYTRSSYFLVGAAAAHGMGFHGPEWIVLAQCSTLNTSTWPLWTRVLGRSSPGVRGILAYEEASPKAKPAAHIAERFFQHLDQGATFLDAWIEANHGQKWAALVHKDARKDTLRAFARFRPLSGVTTTAEKATYQGYIPALGPSGEPVYDRPPPFGFKLEHLMGAMFEEVVPERLGEHVSDFAGGHSYRLTVSAPPGAKLRKVTITVVHLRLSLRDRQFAWSTLFGAHLLAPGVKLEGFNRTALALVPEVESPTIVLGVMANDPTRTDLEESHSYLWFRVAVQTDVGDLQYDFKTQGLAY